jgi:hypothetical protein
VVAIKGVTVKGLKPAMREFRVIALIIDTEQPLVLGAEVMTEQNIVIYPRERRTLLFEGTTYEMSVEVVPWNDMKIKFVNSRLYPSNKTSNNQDFCKVHDDRINNSYK